MKLIKKIKKLIKGNISLKNKCSKAFEKFWANCMEQGRFDLLVDEYQEIEEGIFVNGSSGYKTYLSDVAIDIMEKNIEKAKPIVMAGYYINLHEEKALNDWLINVKDFPLTKTGQKVQNILEKVYGKETYAD